MLPRYIMTTEKKSGDVGKSDLRAEAGRGTGRAKIGGWEGGHLDLSPGGGKGGEENKKKKKKSVSFELWHDENRPKEA